MNPEPSPAESSQVPPEPAGGTDLAGTTARDGAAVGTTVALPGSAAGALPAASTADAPVLSPTADVANAPGLAPAACGARLAELFPALFSAAGAPGPVRPIKLRIHADIQARAPGIFSKRALGIFFSRYTTTNAYLKALTLAPHRFDLDGQAAGEISDEHRQLATEELARRHALAAERRAAQRPAPRRDATTRDDGAAPGAQREPPPAHRPDPRPDARPAAPPRQRPRDSAQRTERRNDAMPPSRSEQSVRPPRRGEPAPRAAHPQRRAPVPPAPESQAPAALPVDPAQRERVLLLRSFAASPLSKANFCALKGISEATLDAALSRAESEGAVKAAQKKSGSL